MKKILLTAALLFIFCQGYGSTYLHRVAYKGDFGKVYRALRQGTKIDEIDSKGRTALFYAIYQSSVYRQRNKYRMARYLIKKGADINKTDFSGRTPLHEAIRYGNSHLATLLIHKGAVITTRDSMGTTPLHEAGRNGMKNVAKMLIARGADINAGDKSGWTPLHEAAGKKNHKLIKILLENNADANAVNEDGNLPLHLACCENNIISVLYLVRATGKFINLKNIFGKTPLFYSVRLGSVPASALLVDNGAAVNESDNTGFTPLFYTARNGNVKIAEFLIRVGANIEHRSKKGITPLHYSARMGNEKMILLLLKKGADEYSKTAGGLTYLDILIKSSHLFQYRKCEKKLPRLYMSYMEGEHSATSYSSNRPYRHSADKCFDNNMKTCWIEGDRGKGIGEKIAFFTNKEIRYISVFPGHGNGRLFKMHNRLQRAKISVYENKYQLYCKFKFGNIIDSIDVSFEDLPEKKKIPVKIKKSSPNGYIVVIEIKSVYRGTRWKNDTCIAEVETI